MSESFEGRWDDIKMGTRELYQCSCCGRIAPMPEDECLALGEDGEPRVTCHAGVEVEALPPLPSAEADPRPRDSITAAQVVPDKTIAIKTPIVVGQKVFLVRSYRGFYPLEGHCPSCRGTGRLVALDGKWYSCPGEGVEGGLEWRCSGGQRRVLREQCHRIFEATCHQVVIQWWREDHYTIQVRLGWQGGDRGQLREHDTVDLDDVFLTREEAEVELADEEWREREHRRAYPNGG